MFHSILIANRGEIACRVIRTARDMGIETIAIYSSADKDSPHVQQASRAYWVGEAAARSSYLNIDAIIAVALASGAEAIHPGYGFLSENPHFARACAEAGIVFIGPSVSALEAMGSKQLAKQRLEHTAVPLTPGYHGNNQDDQHLLNEARRIGFPVLLKAANGGGGKGMRAVHNEADFAQALAGARRESMASFADDTMIIEKLVLNPRHVEVQIMADNHGQVVHVFERDCSIQRRHQKIIEEAPAPGISSGLRWGLAEAACEVARSIEYRGAGTVEFLVSEDEQFYFMEMNTRLQVEHPVTEMISGLDLVAWQIKIAANQHLPCTQDQIRMNGHAIECRIYAEDPHQGFIPSIGQLHFYKPPMGKGIRIDSGVHLYSSISQYYDPMIAKLIAWGETRSEALQRLQSALNQFAIGGVKSNIPFLQAICSHERFVQARLSTDFLSQERISLPEPNQHLALLMAISHDYLALSLTEQDPLWRQSFGWQLHTKSSWLWRYMMNDQQHQARVSPHNSHEFTVELDGIKKTIHVEHHNQRILINDGQQNYHAFVDEHRHQLNVYLENGTVSLERFRWENAFEKSGHGGGKLSAPMPATVVSVLKKPGDQVRQGEVILILEAMKMEHSIQAPRDGWIAEIFYETGSQVNEGAELASLQAENNQDAT
ncbi:acetyl-CoA carboxylase biotin carboxylase subunit [Legionella sp. CNM-4043-24]|uniref:acetyl-CoA carboxylase biotin carboxylase subunit n=1 Tax=Legionella sp. CNM-4043-24 TaxID=3421646 RepID=UPI00403ACAE5